MAGRPEDVSDIEIMEVVFEIASPVASTSQIRDKLPIKHKATLDRLKKLADRGLIEGEKLPNGWVWSISSAGREVLEGEDE